MDPEGRTEAFLRPYVVARPGLPAQTQGGRWHHGLRIDPTRTDSDGFLTALERLDELAYAPHGLETPRWALYDCAELPGAVIGLCVDADHLPGDAHEVLERQNAGTEPWLPVTFLMALPMLSPRSWLVHSICGLFEVMPIGTRDLRPETMELAYAWLGVERVTSICQWRSDRLALHAAWGTLALEAAWVPSHDHPATCVFHYAPRAVRPSSSLTSLSIAQASTAGGAEASASRACASASDSPEDVGVFTIDPSDERSLRALQQELERGAQLEIVAADPASSTQRVWLRESSAARLPSP